MQKNVYFMLNLLIICLNILLQSFHHLNSFMLLILKSFCFGSISYYRFFFVNSIIRLSYYQLVIQSGEYELIVYFIRIWFLFFKQASLITIVQRLLIHLISFVHVVVVQGRPQGCAQGVHRAGPMGLLGCAQGRPQELLRCAIAHDPIFQMKFR